MQRKRINNFLGRATYSLLGDVRGQCSDYNNNRVTRNNDTVSKRIQDICDNKKYKL